MKVLTRMSCLENVSASFAAGENSNESIVCFRSRFKRFVLCLDVRITSSSTDAETIKDQELLLAMPS